MNVGRDTFRIACALAALVVCLVFALPNASAAREKTEARGCRLQKAQNFLVRSSFVQHGQLNGKLHLRAARWRAEQYGSLEGVPELDGHSSTQAHSQAISVRF